jgi:hypothetical protein
MPINREPGKSSAQYMQYAGMAFQLLVLMFIAAYIGDKLDEKWGGDKGYFTAGLVTFFLIGYLYKVYLDVTRDSTK